MVITQISHGQKRKEDKKPRDYEETTYSFIVICISVHIKFDKLR